MTVIIWKESRRRLADARQWACASAAPLLAAWGKAIAEAAPGSLDLPAEHKFLDHWEKCSECQVNVRYWARYGRRNPAAGN